MAVAHLINSCDPYIMGWENVTVILKKKEKVLSHMISSPNAEALWSNTSFNKLTFSVSLWHIRP